MYCLLLHTAHSPLYILFIYIHIYYIYIFIHICILYIDNITVYYCSVDVFYIIFLIGLYTNVYYTYTVFTPRKIFILTSPLRASRYKLLLAVHPLYTLYIHISSILFPPLFRYIVVPLSTADLWQEHAHPLKRPDRFATLFRRRVCVCI